MNWKLLNPWREARHWRDRARKLAQLVSRLESEAKLKEESLQVAVGRMNEVAEERNRSRDELQRWQELYRAERDLKDKIQQQIADWQAISGRGLSIFNSVEIPPQPKPDWSQMEQGPRLARDIVRERTADAMNAALREMGLTPGAQTPDRAMGDDLLRELKREQEEYAARNGA